MPEMFYLSACTRTVCISFMLQADSNNHREKNEVQVYQQQGKRD